MKTATQILCGSSGWMLKAPTGPPPLVTEQLCSPAILQHLGRSYQLSSKGKCPGPFYSWELETINIRDVLKEKRARTMQRTKCPFSSLFSSICLSSLLLWSPLEYKTPVADHPPNQTNAQIQVNSVPTVVPGHLMVLKSSRLEWLNGTVLRTQALAFCGCSRPSWASAHFPFSKKLYSVNHQHPQGEEHDS